MSTTALFSTPFSPPFRKLRPFGYRTNNDKAFPSSSASSFTHISRFHRSNYTTSSTSPLNHHFFCCSSSHKVLLTGATGFVGSAVLQELSRHNAVTKIHATTRDVTSMNFESVKKGIPSSKISYFQADILDLQSLKIALSDCDCVVHVASPFKISVQNVMSDLITPAVNGTLNILRACAESPYVHTVVLTSSVAALRGGKNKVGERIILQESDWNTTSTKQYLPYYFSKTKAEETAWKFMKDYNSNNDNNKRMKLITINPGAVYGPSIIPRLSESVKFVRDIASNKFSTVVDVAFSAVDVRDVAVAHVLPILNANTIEEGRYICVADTGSIHMRDVMRIAKDMGFTNGKTSEMTQNWFSQVLRTVAWVPARLGVVEAQFTESFVGCDVVPDNGKIKSNFGMKFRDIEQSIKDTFEDLEKWGHLAARR